MKSPEKFIMNLIGIKKLAELVEFAKRAKDMRSFDDKKKVQQAKFEKLVNDAISGTKYNSLLESTDPRVVQEAKNSIADLKWTAAEF